MRVRFLDADGADLAERAALRPAAIGWLRRPSVAAHDADRGRGARCASPRPGRYAVGVAGVGPLRARRSTARCSSTRTSARAGRRTPSQALRVPPQRRRPHARARAGARGRRSGSGTARARRASSLPARARRRARRALARRGARARGRARRREADVAVVVVGTTEEVESEGFDRTSTSRCPAARTSSSARVAARQPAHGRRRQRRRAGAAAVARRGRRRPAGLVPRPGVRQRAGRRPARRRRAGRAAADDLAGARGRRPRPVDARPSTARSSTPRGSHIGYRACAARRHRARVPVRPRPRLHDLGVHEPARRGPAVARTRSARLSVALRNTGPRAGRRSCRSTPRGRIGASTGRRLAGRLRGRRGRGRRGGARRARAAGAGVRATGRARTAGRSRAGSSRSSSGLGAEHPLRAAIDAPSCSL